MLGKSKQSINYNDMQEMNRYLIIKLLMQLGICSRVELSRLSGLKQATITNIINDFIKIGLVSEIGSKNGSKGRRSVVGLMYLLQLLLKLYNMLLCMYY